jgi:hypothetical protein
MGTIAAALGFAGKTRTKMRRGRRIDIAKLIDVVVLADDGRQEEANDCQIETTGQEEVLTGTNRTLRKIITEL